MDDSGQNLAVDIGEVSGMAVTLYKTDGSFAGTSLPIQPHADVRDALAITAKGQSAYITEGDVILYLAPLYNADERLGTVQFHGSLAEQRDFYARIRNLFLTTGGAVLAAGFLIGFLYVRRQVGIIARLNEDASRIGQGRYLASPSVRRKDELGHLSRGIFEMSENIASSVRELTEEKRKLIEAIARLEELKRQQKQFIGNISHELKTPLTAILAYSDLLGMYGDDPELLDKASTEIRQEAKRLYKLVEKALKLSSMDVYDFQAAARSLPIVPALREAIGRIQVKADARNIRIEARLEEGNVWADPDNLGHILLNLLDNAVKYNREGGAIRIANAVRPGTDGSELMQIEIADTGIGIPPEERERIFDPFYTVSDDRSRETGGTGLGLPLVRSLAEKQGGTVHLAESGPEGSRFVLELRLFDAEDTETN
ncbi:sensor histidine kinase [Paenibacillus terricola]|nr:HAMP domain-containing sensor histidine kinase [Paenibacillus terricola]